MNLKKRVIAAEQFVLSVVDDGPISIAELMTDWRDVEYRRRIGAAGVRSKVLSFRRMMREMLGDDGDDSTAKDATTPSDRGLPDNQTGLDSNEVRA